MTEVVRRRSNPLSDDTRVAVYSWDDWTGKWVKEADSTLAEFFASSPTLDEPQDRVRYLLSLRRQYVWTAAGRWKLALE